MGWLHLSSTFAMCLITHMTDTHTHTHRHTHTRPEEAIRLQPTICDTHRQRFTYKCVHAVHGTPLACAASDNHSASCTTRQLQFQQISDSSLQSALKACPCMQCRSSPVHSYPLAGHDMPQQSLQSPEQQNSAFILFCIRFSINNVYGNCKSYAVNRHAAGEPV